MRNTLTTSVALITRNGETYINEQLMSITNQSHPPDEIIICDDASTDATLNRVKRFAQTTKIPITLYKNPHRLGVTKNIEKAIRICKNDIIFLCDQDDVWLPFKIKEYVRYFGNRAEINALCSDAQLVDSSCAPLGCSLWETKHYTQQNDVIYTTPHLFRNLIRTNYVCGATLAFRRSCRKSILPIGEGWMHDAWIGALCAGTGSLLMIPDKTILYRQHSRQEIGVNTSTKIKSMRDAMHARQKNYRSYIRALKVLHTRLSTYFLHDSSLWQPELDSALHHYTTRASLPSALHARIPVILAQCIKGNYGKHSSGIYSIAKDIFINR